MSETQTPEPVAETPPDPFARLRTAEAIGKVRTDCKKRLEKVEASAARLTAIITQGVVDTAQDLANPELTEDEVLALKAAAYARVAQMAHEVSTVLDAAVAAVAPPPEPTGDDTLAGGGDDTLAGDDTVQA